MVVNVLADGSVADDLERHVVKESEAPEAYGLMEELSKKED